MAYTLPSQAPMLSVTSGIPYLDVNTMVCGQRTRSNTRSDSSTLHCVATELTVRRGSHTYRWQPKSRHKQVQASKRVRTATAAEFGIAIIHADDLAKQRQSTCCAVKDRYGQCRVVTPACHRNGHASSESTVGRIVTQSVHLMERVGRHIQKLTRNNHRLNRVCMGKIWELCGWLLNGRPQHTQASLDELWCRHVCTTTRPRIIATTTHREAVEV